jgi:hypothetical protein
MPFWDRWFPSRCGSSPGYGPPEVQSPGYGLSKADPILCGGGPSGEREYLERIRCPAGLRVHYERLGSESTTEMEFLNRPGVVVDLGPGVSRRREATYLNPVELPLDVYRLVCDCGQHHAEAFFDMYHLGPEAPLGQQGWTLAPRGSAATE